MPCPKIGSEPNILAFPENRPEPLLRARTAASLPEGWQEVHQSRIEGLNKVIKGWKSLYPDGLSKIQKSAYLLFSEADQLQSLIHHYDNYRDIDSTILLPSTQNNSGHKEVWHKDDGFMTGKAAYVEKVDKFGEFWVFKTPGETRLRGVKEPSYSYSSPESKDKGKISEFNISYSRGFLEVYSLAKILLPDNIPDFKIGLKLKYPEQFFIATRFVENAQAFNPENLEKGYVSEFQKLRLTGSIIGFDDLTFFNLLLGEDGKIKAIDGINPIDDGNSRRNYFDLFERNFFSRLSFFGGCPKNKEHEAQENFGKLTQENPGIIPTVGDLRASLEQVKDKQSQIDALFDIIKKTDADDKSYDSYIKVNISQIDYMISHLQEKGDNHKITFQNLKSTRDGWFKLPSDSPKVDSTKTIIKDADKSFVEQRDS